MSPKEVVKKYWGYEDFRHPQDLVIDSVLKGRDVCAFIPTGGGKSLCFQVPALCLKGVCIVVSPLIALMQDQVNALKTKSIKAEVLQGGMSNREVEIILDNCTYGQVKFLYLSPERLQQELVRERIKQMNVSLLAIDEAHCVSQWGHDFRPAFKKISEIRDLFTSPVNCIALTATATPLVQKEIIELLELRSPQVIKVSVARKNIAIKVSETSDKRKELLTFLENFNGAGIVYVRNRKSTKDLAQFLSSHAIISEAYHGGMPSQNRKEVLANWLNEKTKVVVATNAFGMGIDKPNVRKVVHFHLPESLESFAQEIGRCGRDGLYSEALTVYNESDIIRMKRQFIDVLPEVNQVKEIYRKINDYFGIAYGEGPGNVFDFNFYDFCKKYGFHTNLAYNTLEVLDRLSVLMLQKNFQKKTEIKILVSSGKIIQFVEDNQRYFELIPTILRIYSGVFDYSVQVDLELIAHRSNLSKKKVSFLLNELANQKIIEAKIKNQDLSLSFLVPKENERTINPLSKEIKAYKKGKLKQAKAVIGFLKNTNQCRNIQITNYFGEKVKTDCGMCSVCLSSQQLSTLTQKQVCVKIVNVLEKESLDLKSLERSTQLTKDQLIDGLRRLLDQNKIEISRTKTYKLR